MDEQLSGPYIKIGKDGAIAIPAEIHRELGVEQGDTLFVDVSADGSVVLKPVSSDPLERLRNAFAGSFDGIDPVAYQRALRDEDDE